MQKLNKQKLGQNSDMSSNYIIKPETTDGTEPTVIPCKSIFMQLYSRFIGLMLMYALTA